MTYDPEQVAFSADASTTAIGNDEIIYTDLNGTLYIDTFGADKDAEGTITLIFTVIGGDIMAGTGTEIVLESAGIGSSEAAIAGDLTELIISKSTVDVKFTAFTVTASEYLQAGSKTLFRIDAKLNDGVSLPRGYGFFLR